MTTIGSSETNNFVWEIACAELCGWGHYAWSAGSTSTRKQLEYAGQCRVGTIAKARNHVAEQRPRRRIIVSKMYCGYELQLEAFLA